MYMTATHVQDITDLFKMATHARNVQDITDLFKMAALMDMFSQLSKVFFFLFHKIDHKLTAKTVMNVFCILFLLTVPMMLFCFGYPLSYMDCALAQ